MYFKRVLILNAIMALLLLGCGTTVNEELENIDLQSEALPEDELESTQDECMEETEGDEQVTLPLRTDIEIEAGKEALEPEDFLEQDADVELEIKTQLTQEELSVAGAEYEVVLFCQNQEVNVLVRIVDTVPPTIVGVKNLTIYAGDSVSYKKNISLLDNSSGEVSLEVDTSAVDIQTIGDYPVTYSATDEAENCTTEKITLHVIAAPVIDETTVGPMADEVIAKVITQEMTKYEMAYVLWEWCRNNIYYSSTTKNCDELWQCAYQGLHNKKGSCYVYAYTYSLLLSRCGIDNMCIRRCGGQSNHIWNLVNTGDGWYHCDSSPRRNGDGYLCFMQTDAQVQAYTDSYPEHPNYYTFDASLYPERAGTIIFGQ